jgi:hypothetical protein
LSAGNGWREILRHSTNSMKFTSKSGFLRSWDAAWAAGLLLMVALCVTGRLDGARGMSRSSYGADPRASRSGTGGGATSESNRHTEITNYFMDFDGDHSLDMATVIEQSSAGYTNYTVQLHLASGAEQSVVVSAPPGGLQVEMHDMTGDKVPNDVVLRPALVGWLPTILVNDGHEHFEVVMSSTDPNYFSSNEDLGSRRHDTQTFALLMTSGLTTVHLPNCRRLFAPQLLQSPYSSFTQAITDRMSHTSSPGRAPPLLIAI